MEHPLGQDIGSLRGHPRNVAGPGTSGAPDGQPGSHAPVNQDPQRDEHHRAHDKAERGDLPLVLSGDAQHGVDAAGSCDARHQQQEHSTATRDSNLDGQDVDRPLIAPLPAPEWDASPRARNNTSQTVLTAPYFKEHFSQICGAEVGRSCLSVNRDFRELALDILERRLNILVVRIAIQEHIAIQDPEQSKVKQVAALVLRRWLGRALRAPASWLFTKLAPFVVNLVSNRTAHPLGWAALDLVLTVRRQPTLNVDVDLAGVQHQLEHLVGQRTHHSRMFDIAGGLLDIPNDEVRMSALVAMQRMASWGDQVGMQGQTLAVVRCLEDAEPSLRFQALATLKEFWSWGGPWGAEIDGGRDLGQHPAEDAQQQAGEAGETLADVLRTALARAHQVATLLAAGGAVRNTGLLNLPRDLPRENVRAVWRSLGLDLFRCTLDAAGQGEQADMDARVRPAAARFTDQWARFLRANE